MRSQTKKVKTKKILQSMLDFNVYRQTDYEEHGTRRSVEGLMIVHEHGFPHILLLQVANAFFKLPGDYLKPHEEDHAGLRNRLHSRLGPDSNRPSSDDTTMNETITSTSAMENDWVIGDCLGRFYRPNYESFMYPYVTAHISDPKEVKSLYLVELPERKVLTVPKNMKIIAVPLFELYDNAVRYGPQLAAIPNLLSKYTFVFSP